MGWGFSFRIYIIRLFRYRFKLGKSAKYSLGSFEFTVSASSSLPLWSYGELGMSNYYVAKSLYFMVEPKLRRFSCK
ncbi:hypothetical protein PIB30_115490, partial [Stylosanthes scabra]|nr:hypothetical protein [Stylosanthes scabra]